MTFPGVRLPWEELVEACQELRVLSLVDGAHGIGHIDLTHVSLMFSRAKFRIPDYLKISLLLNHCLTQRETMNF